jgi:hypothetical protein
LLRVKEKVIATVAKRQSTNGAEQRKSSETKPICTRRSAFKAAHDITSGMADENRGKVDRSVSGQHYGRAAKKPMFCVRARL